MGEPSPENLLPTKPFLRGYFHQEAFFVALGASALLIAKSVGRLALAASLVYSFTLVLLFGISAIYHRINWQPKGRLMMKRLDHSAIFLVIAGTFTPICLLALSEQRGRQLFLVIWSAAVVGVIQSNFWTTAPKWLTAVFYVVMGWVAIPYLTDLHAGLGTFNLSLIGAGGIVYTLGALFYVIKRPNFIPGYFGYHELFHICTIIGAILHFILVFRLVT